MRPALLALALLVGCGGAQKDALQAVRSSAEFAQAVEPILVGAYQLELRVCGALEQGTDECAADVRKRWTPILEKYDAARKAWCTVDAAIGQGKCP